MEGNREQILHMSFNQNQTCLAVGTQIGFKVFKIGIQIQQVLSREFGAGLGIVQMIDKTNIFALVGGGRIPRYPKNKLMIWDDFQSKCIVETSCKSEIRAVKISSQKVIVILQTKIFLFNLVDFRPLQTFQTCPNPLGLCSMAAYKKCLMLAFPSKKIGNIEVINEQKGTVQSIQAHKSCVNALQLCASGLKVATASQKGTLIRVFDTCTLQCLEQLRRGSQYATIYSLAFDPLSQWLACTSDSGTMHVFGLQAASEEHQNGKESKNTKSKLAILSKLSPYFDSKWSWTSFPTQKIKNYVGFISHLNHLAVVDISGKIVIVRFDDAKNSNCIQVGQYALIDRK